MTELLGGYFKVAGGAQVLSVVILVAATVSEWEDVVHDVGKPGDASAQAALAEAVGAV